MNDTNKKTMIKIWCSKEEDLEKVIDKLEKEGAKWRGGLMPREKGCRAPVGLYIDNNNKITYDCVQEVFDLDTDEYREVSVNEYLGEIIMEPEETTYTLKFNPKNIELVEGCEETGDEPSAFQKIINEREQLRDENEKLEKENKKLKDELFAVKLNERYSNGYADALNSVIVAMFRGQFK